MLSTSSNIWTWGSNQNYKKSDKPESEDVLANLRPQLHSRSIVNKQKFLVLKDNNKTTSLLASATEFYVYNNKLIMMKY